MRMLNIFLISFGLVFLMTACQSEKINGQNPSATVFTKAVDYTEAAKINTQLAAFYIQQEHYDLAKKKILTAIKQDKNYAYAYSVLAYYDEKTGDDANAEKNYLQAIKLAPKDGTFHNNYGRFLCLNKKYTEALTQFDLAVSDKDYINMAGVYENAGFCALQMDNKKLAAQYFNRAILQNPNQINSLYELSKIEVQQGQYTPAKEHLWRYSHVVSIDRDAALLGLKISKKLKDGLGEKYYEQKLFEKGKL